MDFSDRQTVNSLAVINIWYTMVTKVKVISRSRSCKFKVGGGPSTERHFSLLMVHQLLCYL